MADESLPPELSERIAAARDVLDNRADGHLPLRERRELRGLFGDEAAGHRRRFELNRSCVHRVLPVWREARPDDRRPDRMVELAEQVMEGRISIEHAAPEEEEFTVELMDIAADIGGRVNAAGEAAVDLLATAATGDYGEEVPLDADDHDLDPDQLEGSFLGSIAVASYTGAPDDDPDARRSFWRWYLDEAVPAAYSSVGG